MSLKLRLNYLHKVYVVELSLPYAIIVALFHDTIHWHDQGTMGVIKPSAFEPRT